MTSRRSILLGLVFGAFLGVFGLNSVYAQVPRSISYQGLLVKNSQPVNTPVNIDIKIYDAANTVLYQETESQVPVNNGIFNITLGGISGTLPSSLKFDEQYFLGVSVEGTPELPHTAFVAAPYALNAQTVGGVGVSLTPQAGMLLPLDQNGKVPKAALPQAATTLTSIDHMTGDATTGNVQIVSGNVNTLTVTDNVAANTITLTALTGSSPDTLITNNGLQGGGIGSKWTIGIAPNGILGNMIGTGVITGIKLDQNVPQNGLYQDALGQLNVGTNATLIYVQPTNPFAPVKSNGGLSLNLSNPNTWLALQTFNAGITVNGTTTLNGPTNQTGPINITGNETLNGNLVVNGTPEPLAGPNGATYEIIDNGDLKVTGSSYLVGNTYIGAATNGGTNTMGTAGQSANTITGTTNAITGTTSNSIQSPANSIGTANAGSTNTIGNAGTSTNTVTGANNTVTATAANTVTAGTSNTITAGTSNTLTATTSNNIQSPANNIGTTNASSANTIGNGGTSTNTVTGLTNNLTSTLGGNNITSTSTNNMQAPTNNIGTSQVIGNTNNIGTNAASTNVISGVTDNIHGATINIGALGLNPNNAVNIGSVAGNTTTTILGLTASVNATTNNMGTSVAGSVNNIGTATSVNTINGTTTFNGAHIVNGNSTFAGNITQTAPGTTATFLATNTGNLTVTGTLTQSGGNAQIAGGATNTFGTVLGSNNTIGAAGGTNTITGATNNIAATTLNNLTGNTQTQNLQVNGTLGSTGNITLGTVSSNNVIGNAGAINTITGSSNNFTAGSANNFTGDIIQISGRVNIAPTASTTNNFGNAASQINNFGTGASTTNNIGTGNGSVTNIGTVSGGGISTTNIGNLNAGTNNNINGLTTVQFTGDQTYLRVAGGVASCAGAFPTGAQSELLVNGDGWFDGTLAACRLNIFGAGGSCITNLNTTNFGSCGGPGVPINLISSIIGVPSGAGATDLTNMRNIQASTSVQTNLTLTIGVPGTNATNITSSNAGPASIAQQTPSVSGRIPTFQQYALALVPASGPNGGGSVTFTTVNAPGLNFDANSGISVTYRTHNGGIPVGELWVTQTLTTVTVESSAALDNNTVQIIILRP